MTLNTAFGSDIHWAEDAVTIGFLTALIAAGHSVLHRFVFEPLAARYVPRPKVSQMTSPPVTPEPGKHAAPQLTPMQEYALNQRKFTTSIYKFIGYSLMFLIGLWANIGDNQQFAWRMRGGDGDAHWLWDGWLIKGLTFVYKSWPDMQLRQVVAGGSSSILPWSQYGSWILGMLGFESSLNGDGAIIESPILFHYQFALAFYIYSTILVYFDLEGPKQKDKYQMLSHHLITMFLIAFSWYFQFSRIGALVLVLHDVADPLMELAKMSLYAGYQSMANGWFGVFTLAFLLSRCILFPLTIIYPTLAYVCTPEGQAKAQMVTGWWLAPLGLVALQGLHIFWGHLVVKIVIGSLSNGNLEGDIRDEE